MATRPGDNYLQKKSKIYFSEKTLICKKGSNFAPGPPGTKGQGDKKMSLSRDYFSWKGYSKPATALIQNLPNFVYPKMILHNDSHNNK